ncbi:Cytosolic seryl-tRNA synthetase [Stygiomarasmius scandens]|uniref:Seryl-tRNA(Ser) synthetase n=1 Tax=Marasmiellus scandens TaxID=2682957 RepID=A0ABR1IT61_9AGAR
MLAIRRTFEKKLDQQVAIWGIFRVHQFEKVEQFIVDDPEKDWETLENMIINSEEFYRVVGIVSSALNLAAAQKYDLEAWLALGPVRLINSSRSRKHIKNGSCSNCTYYRDHELFLLYGLDLMGICRSTKTRGPLWA